MKLLLNLVSLGLIYASPVNGEAQASKHPRVEAANNFITLDERNNIDYFGPVYVGSEFRENHVIFDTASDWTVIVDVQAKGKSFPANYDSLMSKTLVDVYADKNGTTLKTVSLN